MVTNVKEKKVTTFVFFYSLIHLFFFVKCFILIMAMENPKPSLEILGFKWIYTQDGMPVHHRTT